MSDSISAPDSCVVAECARPIYVAKRSLCKRHYYQARRRGEFGAGQCVVDGCGKPGPERGSYCNAHYQRHLHHGDPLGGNPSPSVPRALDHADDTRTCTLCHERKALDLFGKDGSATLGRRSQCKACRSAKEMDRYNADPETHRQAMRDRLRNNPDVVRAQDRARYERHRDKRVAIASIAVDRRRARQAGVEFDRTVTRPNLRKQYGDDCHYCGVTMTFKSTPRGSGLRPDNLATLEHVEPICLGGAHTWTNCVLACWRCNISKNKMDLREWVDLMAVS